VSASFWRRTFSTSTPPFPVGRVEGWLDLDPPSPSRQGQDTEREDRGGRHGDDVRHERHRDLPAADVCRAVPRALVEASCRCAAPLDLGRLEQLARPRERPQEVGRASRVVPHLFPHERLHVGVVRRQRDDVAEIRRGRRRLAGRQAHSIVAPIVVRGPTMLTGAGSPPRLPRGSHPAEPLRRAGRPERRLGPRSTVRRETEPGKPAQPHRLGTSDSSRRVTTSS